ncbi:MAG: hypothetical protein QOH63_1952 [Acidobacteriota bacterium]|nr:hypothetical protein [Acidobacteriota bacterium]
MRGVDSFMPSKLESNVGKVILEQFGGFSIKRNIRPAWLTSPEGERLELDFYLPELRIAFEIQGAQHYRYVPHFHRTTFAFRDQVRRDACKRKLCVEQRITLFEVSTLDEYYALDEKLVKIIDDFHKHELENHILRRVAQEFICNGGVQQKVAKIREALTLTSDEKQIKQLNRYLKKHVFDLELSNERIKCLSVVAINDFEGREVIRGRLRFYAMRRNKKVAGANYRRYTGRHLI